MEIVNGRECEPMLLGNGDTLYFITKIKGREYRLLKERFGSVVKMGLDTKAEYDFGGYMGIIAKAIDIFVCQIKTKEGVMAIPTLDYFDSLEAEDADLLYKKLEKQVNSDGMTIKKN